MTDATDKLPHRGHELLDVLARLGGSARNAQIAQVMDVSEETVRRLVVGLAAAGKVARVHGGTYLSSEQDTPLYSGALEQNAVEKGKVARAILPLIRDGMTLFLNVGSTTTYIAEQLREKSNLLVVTNSISVVASLAQHNGSRVFLTGGEVNRAERGCFGRAAEDFARQFAYDAVVVGADGISADHGFLTANPQEAEMTRAVADQSQQLIVAADAAKFNRRAPCMACPPHKITDLVVDASPDDGLARALEHWNVRVHTPDGTLSNRMMPEAALS